MHTVYIFIYFIQLSWILWYYIQRTWLVESTWIEPVGNWAKGKLWYGGKHRFWNKNMSPSGDPKCMGVDLDRNFPTPRWTEGPHIQVTTNKGSNKGSGHSSKAKIVVSIDTIQQLIYFSLCICGALRE